MDNLLYSLASVSLWTWPTKQDVNTHNFNKAAYVAVQESVAFLFSPFHPWRTLPSSEIYRQFSSWQLLSVDVEPVLLTELS